jgi:hypothetical protein
MELANVKTLKKVNLEHSRALKDEGVINLVQSVPTIEELKLNLTSRRNFRIDLTLQ